MSESLTKVLEIMKQKAADRLVKIAEIKTRIDAFTLSQGFELDPVDTGVSIF